MADQICYSVLCVFSYVAAGSEKRLQASKHTGTSQPTVLAPLIFPTCMQPAVSPQEQQITFPVEKPQEKSKQTVSQSTVQSRQVTQTSHTPRDNTQKPSPKQTSAIQELTPTPSSSSSPETGSVTPVGGPPTYPPPSLPPGVPPPAPPPIRSYSLQSQPSITRPNKPPPIPSRSLPPRQPSSPQPPPRPK